LKKKQKTFAPALTVGRRSAGAKVFWFFFSKKHSSSAACTTRNAGGV
jgi:hypothetical protein